MDGRGNTLSGCPETRGCKARGPKGFSFAEVIQEAQVFRNRPALAVRHRAGGTASGPGSEDGRNITSVILKATTEVGSLPVNAGVVSVKCTEITDTGSGHKEQGIAIEHTQKGQPKDKMLIDYDEIPYLVNVIDYLNKVDFSVTPRNAFDAAFTTKGGFRIAALGTRRTGVIQFGVRDARTNLAPFVLSRSDMSRFAIYIGQAKGTLDSLRRS